MSIRAAMRNAACGLAVAGLLIGATAPVALAAPADHVAAATTSAPAWEPTMVTTTPGANWEKLESKPDAPKTIWLVFDGGTVTDSPWNAQRVNPARNGTPITFTPVPGDSKQLRREVFQRLSEYFSPFDVNITTQRPSRDALARDSQSDTQYGGIAIFSAESLGEDGGNGLSLVENALGVAHFSSFGDLTDEYAWTTAVGQEPRNPKQLAATAAHEIGHLLGLNHHGWTDGTEENRDEYYTPQTGLWAPIMGNGDDVGGDRWSDGQYPGATNPGQDDLAVMTDSGYYADRMAMFLHSTHAPYDGAYCGSEEQLLAGQAYVAVDDACPDTGREYLDVIVYASGRIDFRADDNAGTRDAAATALPLGAKTPGVIERNGDVDAFRVTSPGSGLLDVSAVVPQYAPMLDVKLTVSDDAGTVLGTFDPALGTGDLGGRRAYLTGESASGRVRVTAGTYYVTVEGVGFGDLSQVTRTNTSMAAAAYGSIGEYTVSASLVTPVLTGKVDGRQVTLAGTLDGAPAALEYSLDGGAAWQDYSAPFTVPGTGGQTVVYRAKAGGDSASVAVTSTAASTAVAPLGTEATVVVGDTVFGNGARVTDAQGAPVAGVTVTFAVNGNGPASNLTAITNADGIAVVPSMTATTAGDIVIQATAGGSTQTLPVVHVVDEAPASKIDGWADVATSVVSGKVVLTVRSYNGNDSETVRMQIKTKYGSKTYDGIDASKGVIVTFKTYTASIPAGSATSTFTGASGIRNFGATYAAVP